VQRWNENIAGCDQATHDEQKACIDFAQQAYLNELKPYLMSDYYKWSWPFLLIAVLAAPVVAYLLCYSIIATFAWITRGFKTA